MNKAKACGWLEFHATLNFRTEAVVLEMTAFSRIHHFISICGSNNTSNPFQLHAYQIWHQSLCCQYHEAGGASTSIASKREDITLLLITNSPPKDADSET